MSNRMWEVLVEHAKTCVLSGKYYIYYSDDTRNIGAIFNNIYEFTGLIAGGQYFSAESLNDSQKVGNIWISLPIVLYLRLLIVYLLHLASLELDS